MKDLLKNLNPAQQEAVQALRGPVLILAGAGSGKTKTLTTRIAHIIQQKKARADEILAVTFTNKAAGEMKERVKKLLGIKSDKQLSISTFHSLCVRILRREIAHLNRPTSFTILDTDEQLTAVKQAMRELNVDSSKYAPGAILSYISGAKNEMVGPEEYSKLAQGHFQQSVAKIYPRYQELLHKNNSVDFDDLLLLTVKLFKQEPKVLEKYQKLFKYVMVDEYQDTNAAQYQLTKLLSDKHHNLFVVGDDWQSIYSWRGANYRNILNFNRDYPAAKVIKLEENYRSTQNILDAAGAVIALNQNRSQKKLWTGRGPGEPIAIINVPTEQYEGAFIIEEIARQQQLHPELTLNDFVVLYRTNAQSRSLEEAFIKRSTPYRVVGGVRFYDRKEIKDVLAYLRVIANPQDEISLQRIINVPTRGIGEKGWEGLCKFAAEEQKNLSEVLDIVPVGGRAKIALTELAKTIKQARSWKKNLSGLFDLVVNKTNYLTFLNDKTIEGETRIENVKELKSVVEKYDYLESNLALQTFLEEVSLIQDIDSYNENNEAVTLMTLHSAKGLEFDSVFIAGMEENLFPHSRSLLDREELEEERRLCYVGITRAKRKIYLLHATQRLIYGKQYTGTPSRFLDDIPVELTTTGVETTEAITTATEKPAQNIRVKTGDMVEHVHFGVGSVIRTSSDEIVVLFGKLGVKRLAKGLAPIKKLAASKH
ncbi:UvrD-helicase domain-containing protein [Patescibacteria group bacterium]|nr:UvrD-helicase domain-containing protein [Patescibacteria group bacterium]